MIPAPSAPLMYYGSPLPRDFTIWRANGFYNRLGTRFKTNTDVV